MLSAEMLPPWEDIPQGWSQRLLHGKELKQFDPDNVIPVPEMINPNTGTTNPASWLIQGAPRLPEFQVPKLFILDQCTGTTVMCLAGVVGKEAGSLIATFDTDSELVGIDNGSSVCMSPHRSDFSGKLIKSKRFIKAFGGTKSFDIYNHKTSIQNQRRKRIGQTNPYSQAVARRTHPQSKKDTTGYSLQDPKETCRSHPLDTNSPTHLQQTKTMGMHHKTQTRKENKPQQTQPTPESNKNLEPGQHLPPGSA